MAIGARPVDILRATTLQTLTLVGIGIGLGLLSSTGVAMLVRNLLFEVSPWNLETQMVSAGVVTLCAVLAALWPIVQAARLDPSVALRHS